VYVSCVLLFPFYLFKALEVSPRLKKNIIRALFTKNKDGGAAVVVVSTWSLWLWMRTAAESNCLQECLRENVCPKVTKLNFTRFVVLVEKVRMYLRLVVVVVCLLLSVCC